MPLVGVIVCSTVLGSTDLLSVGTVPVIVTVPAVPDVTQPAETVGVTLLETVNVVPLKLVYVEAPLAVGVVALPFLM